MRVGYGLEREKVVRKGNTDERIDTQYARDAE
jgi:hypothetical protein